MYNNAIFDQVQSILTELSAFSFHRRDAWKLLQFKMMPDVCKMLQDTVESRNLTDITYPIIDPFV